MEFEISYTNQEITPWGEHGVWTNKRKDVFGSTGNFVTIAKVCVDAKGVIVTPRERK